MINGRLKKTYAGHQWPFVDVKRSLFIYFIIEKRKKKVMTRDFSRLKIKHSLVFVFFFFFGFVAFLVDRI